MPSVVTHIAGRVAVLAHGAIIQMLDRDAGDVLSEANLLTALHQETGIATQVPQFRRDHDD